MELNLSLESTAEARHHWLSIPPHPSAGDGTHRHGHHPNPGVLNGPARDAGGANHPISPAGLSPSCCSHGLGDTRQRRGWEQPSHRDPTPCLRHPGPVRRRGGRAGRDAGTDRSVAAGRALPPGRLAQGKAAQMRIRAATFPRAAHMCQVKRGFGSWQRCPEQGTRASGQILGSLPPTPASVLRGSGQPT